MARKIRPHFRFSDEPSLVKVQEGVEGMMYRAEVIYNQGEVMCT